MDSLEKFSDLLDVASTSVKDFDDVGEVDRYTCKFMMAHILACLGTLRATMSRCKSFDSAEMVIFQGAVAVLTNVEVSSNQCTQVHELLALQKNSDLQEYTPDAPDAPDNDDFIQPQPVAWLPHFWAATVPTLSTTLLEGLLARDVRVTLKGAPSMDYATIGHVAAATRYNNVAILQLILQYYPEMALCSDGNGDLPLHFAARYSDSVEVIRYLLRLNPDALTTKNHRGRSPLHILASRLTRDHIDLLDCMMFSLQGATDAFLAVDKAGDTPLHCTVGKRRANDPVVFKRLLEICPAAADVKNKQDELAAYLFCEHVDFTDSASQELFDTAAASYTAATDSTNLTESIKKLFLCVLSNKKGIWAIKRVLDTHHESLCAWGQYNFAPLIYLLHGDPTDTASIEIVQRLLRFRPSYTDSATHLLTADVLHLAARSWPVPVTKLIYEAYPAAIKMRSQLSIGVPLFSAIICSPHSINSDQEWETRCEVIDYLHSLYPDAIELTEPEGSTALQLAANANCKMLEKVYHLYPQAISELNVEHLSPLYVFLNQVIEDNRENGWSRISPRCDVADRLRFFLRMHPRAAAALIQDGYTYYDEKTEKSRSKRALPKYFKRLLLRAAPKQDPESLHRINYSERRGAMYLLFAATLRNERDMRIWHRIRNHGDPQLIKEIVSFL